MKSKPNKTVYQDKFNKTERSLSFDILSLTSWKELLYNSTLTC